MDFKDLQLGLYLVCRAVIPECSPHPQLLSYWFLHWFPPSNCLSTIHPPFIYLLFHQSIINHLSIHSSTHHPLSTIHHHSPTLPPSFIHHLPSIHLSTIHLISIHPSTVHPPSIHPSIHASLSIHSLLFHHPLSLIHLPSIHPSTIHHPATMHYSSTIHPSIYYPSITHPFIYFIHHSFIHQSIHSFIHPFIHLSLIHLPSHPSIHPSIYPSTHSSTIYLLNKPSKPPLLSKSQTSRGAKRSSGLGEPPIPWGYLDIGDKAVMSL